MHNIRIDSLVFLRLVYVNLISSLRFGLVLSASDMDFIPLLYHEQLVPDHVFRAFLCGYMSERKSVYDSDMVFVSINASDMPVETERAKIDV